MLSHRKTTVLKQVASGVVPQFAASYTITAYPVGAVCSLGAINSTVQNVEAGHGFVAGDKALIDPGDANRFTASINSVTATTITFSVATTVSTGDLLVNLGPDTGSGTPNYDGSPLKIYSDPDGSTPISNSRVTCDPAGEYSYFHRGDGRFWELIRNSSGTVIEVVPGFGAVVGRLSGIDYGCVGDDSTDNTKRLQAMLVGASEMLLDLSTRHNTVYLPAGIYRVTAISLWVLGTNRNRLILQGDGPDNTHIRGTDTTSDVLTVSGNYTTIRDLTVDADATRAAGTSTAYADGTATAGAHGVALIPSDTSTTQLRNELINVIVEDHPDDGVFAMQPEQLYMRGVVSQSNGRFGFHLNGQTNGIGTQNKADTCRAYQNVGRGWYIRTINHSTFINCEALQCDTATEFFYLHGGRGNTLIEPDIEDTTFNTGTGLLVVGEKHKLLGGIFFGFQTPISLSTATNCWIVRPHITNSGLGTNADCHVRIANAGAADNYLDLGTLSSTADALYVFAAAAPGTTIIGDEDFQTLTVNSTTPSVRGGHKWKTNNSSGTLIANFLQAYTGQRILVLIDDANTDFAHSASLKLSGAANWTTPASGDIIEFVYDGTGWRETNRSDNT